MFSKVKNSDEFQIEFINHIFEIEYQSIMQIYYLKSNKSKKMVLFVNFYSGKIAFRAQL